MSPERWQRVKDIFQSALERAPEERSAFLSSACGRDEALRKEVESLIAAHEKDGSFIDSPAYEAAAELLVDENSELRAGQTIEHYEILSTLGKGGMGEVYLAHDNKLGRKVALKFLPGFLTKDAERLRRFEQEARAASALNHPNIITIHEIGGSDDQRFIATEFIDGETLRQRMAQPMKIGETLSIGEQVASALAAAHAAGIIHRDIKPENIMIRPDGYVKVLDFGLAKLAQPKETDAEDLTRRLAQTRTGAVMGTTAYMSPEQARGLAVDARTDIWSLGVVLYEIVTGRAPFEGSTTSDLLVSILEREPVALSSSSADVTELEWIVMKALTKDREDRYQTAREMHTDLRRLRRRLDAGAEFESSARGRSAALESKQTGSIDNYSLVEQAAHAASWAIKKQAKRKVNWAVLAISVMLASALYFWNRSDKKTSQPSSTVRSIAVLPFKPIVADNRDGSLELGMADSLITHLSNIHQVIVRPTSAVRKYAGLEQDPVAAGRELNVDSVLDGSIQKVGERIEVRVRLVSVPDGKSLWAGHFDEKFADIFSVQDSISSKVAAALALTLSGKEEALLTSHSTENSGAYQLYINGRYYWSERTEEGLRKGIEYFQQAINADPNYPLAYSGLADSYTTLGYLSYLAPKEAFPKAREAAEKAIKLDATLAEPHASLAYFKLYYDWNWEEAEKEFKLAIELNPNYATAHHWYGVYLTAMGRSDQALAELQRAQELDPLSLTIGTDMGFELYYSQQYDQAVKQLMYTIEKSPEFPLAHLWLGRAYQQKGKYEEAIAEFKKTDSVLRDWPVTIAAIGNVYGVWGKKNEALQVLKELGRLAKEKYVTPYGIALVYAGLGDKDQAFKWLNEAYEQRSHWLVWLKLDPRWDNLHTDPRFTALLGLVGLSS